MSPGPINQIRARAKPVRSTRPSTIILRTVSNFRTWLTAGEIDCRSSRSTVSGYRIPPSATTTRNCRPWFVVVLGHLEPDFNGLRCFVVWRGDCP